MPEASFGKGPDLRTQAAALGLGAQIPRGPVRFVPVDRNVRGVTGRPKVNVLPASPGGVQEGPTKLVQAKAGGPNGEPTDGQAPTGPRGPSLPGEQTADQVVRRPEGPIPPIVPPDARTERAGGGDACGEMVGLYNQEVLDTRAELASQPRPSGTETQESPFLHAGWAVSSRLLNESTDTRTWSDVPASEQESYRAALDEAERAFVSLTQNHEPIRVSEKRRYFEPIFMGDYPVMQDDGQVVESPVVVQPMVDGTPGTRTAEYQLAMYHFDTAEMSGEPSITNGRLLGYLNLIPSGDPLRSTIDYVRGFQQLAQQADARQRAAAEQAERATDVPSELDGEATDPERTDGEGSPGRIPIVRITSEPGDRARAQDHLEPFSDLPTPLPEVSRREFRNLDLNVGVTAVSPHLGPYTTDPDSPDRFAARGIGSLVIKAADNEGKLVAVKISLYSEQRATEVFNREAHLHGIAAGVTANVPALVDAGMMTLPASSLLRRNAGEKQFATIVTEWVPGRDLKELQQADPTPLTIPQAVARHMPLAEGIDAIGQAGVVHRDIKKDNIIVDENGIAHLIDFSVATTVGTTNEARWGPKALRAPEQERQGVMEPETNVFQFGLMVLDEVTRKRGIIPYQRNIFTPANRRYQQLLDSGNYGQHVQEWLAGNDVPMALRAPFIHVLAENQAHRPTAVAFMRELEQANR